jgi:hypothetical protein
MNAHVSYYNTVALTGAELSAAIAAAQTQDEKVLCIFRRHPRIALSPSQVWRLGYGEHGLKWLLTSCRRSITNLTDAGCLHATGQRVMGLYAHREGTWSLTPPAEAAPAQEDRT